jgi:hypothetical protein
MALTPNRLSIGYTVSSRFSWGMRGGYFPVVIRAFVGVWFFGIQGISCAPPHMTCSDPLFISAYWGGQAVRVVSSIVGAVQYYFHLY